MRWKYMARRKRQPSWLCLSPSVPSSAFQRPRARDGAATALEGNPYVLSGISLDTLIPGAEEAECPATPTPQGICLENRLWEELGERLGGRKGIWRKLDRIGAGSGSIRFAPTESSFPGFQFSHLRG